METMKASSLAPRTEAVFWARGPWIHAVRRLGAHSAQWRVLALAAVL